MRRKESIKGFILMALILASSFLPSCLALNINSLDSEITDEISELIESGDIPSLQLCVVSGEEKWIKGFGEQTDKDTVFLIGSIQKVFVAVSILQLYEKGLIELNDDINLYMPFSIRHPQYLDTPITIKMLLSHRSGLDGTLPSEFAYDWVDDNPTEWTRSFPEDLVGIPLEGWLELNLDDSGSLYSPSYWVREPDTGYSYSNSGYKILMCILERVSGQSIQDYMDENIFTPLHMGHTGFDSIEFMGMHAIPHTRMYGNDTNIPLPVWNGRYMLRSSASDMGNLMMALMNDGVFGGSRILEADSIKLMSTNTRRSIFFRELIRKLKTDGYGMGLEVCNHGLMGHGGSTVGFTGEIYFNPSKDVGFVRLSNVNAILDYTSEGWRDIGYVTGQIRTKLLFKLGLLPFVDYIWLFPVTGSLILLFRNRRRILENMNKRFDLGAKNSS
jgi:CubicO group peptidase (beta-lactamase class C family)